MALPLRDRDSVGIVVVVLFALIGVDALSSRGPLSSGRPTGRLVPLERAESLQDRPARLWQDPLAVLDKNAATSPATREDSPERSLRMLRELVKPSNNTILVLPILVRGGAFFEDQEQRRRSRYAVVSALLECGYSPVQGDAVGRLSLSTADKEPISAAIELYRPSLAAFDQPEAARARTIAPRVTEMTASVRGTPAVPVLLVWLSDQTVTGERAQQVLTSLRQWLASPGPGADDAPLRPVLRPIGPYSSDSLADMLASSTGAIDKWTTVSATVSRRALKLELAARAAADPSGADSASWARLCADDERMADLLVDELRNHRVPTGETALNRVILVSEADTTYARRFTEELDVRLRSEMLRCPGVQPLVAFRYLRGLDGVNPEAARPDTAAPAPSKSAVPATPQPMMIKAGAYGDRQLDYLERLVERIKGQEAKAGAPFTAVGLLGTDFYDKVLLLQALRPRFPGVRFFTTDLDAEMLAPQYRPFMRNLLVASSYGLELGESRLGSGGRAESLQGSCPPFRDSYQTAMYLGTLLLINEERARSAWNAIKREGADRPENRLGHVYEVGRTAFHRLTPTTSVTEPFTPADPGELSIVRNVTACLVSLWLLLGLFAYLLAWRRSTTGSGAACPDRAEARGGSAWRHTPWGQFWMWWLLLLGVVASVLALAYGLPRTQTVDKGGEPATWPFTDGVNAWPTITLTILVGLYAFGSIVLLLRRWRSTYQALSSDYALGDPLEEGGADAGPPQKAHRSIFMLGWVAARPPIAPIIWRSYRYLGSRRRRLFRSSIFALLYGVLGALLWLAGWHNYPLPLRGAWVQTAYSVSIVVSGLIVALLVFLVWDAFRLAERLVHMHTLDLTLYAKSSIDRIGSEWGIPVGSLDKSRAAAQSYLDVAIVGRLTTDIGSSIYPPILALFLLVVGRNERFDNWIWSPLLVLVAFVLGCVVILSVLSLRRAAAQLRAEELRRLEKLRFDLELEEQPVIASRVASMTRAIENMNLGAFTGLKENPAVNALLIPTLGTAALLILNSFLGI